MSDGTVRGVEEGIVVEGIRHRYPGGNLALDGVDLAIGRGLFGLLGPNGAGKSTLMRIVCTLLVPSGGRVRVLGHDVVRERAAVRRLLGYLPQEFGAWRKLRVAEVLELLARLSGLHDPRVRRARIAEILERVGLAGVADRKVKALSGGMVRRLGVAQALVHDPEVIVVDEPTVGLDPEERIRFRQMMADLGEDRVILLSTHIVADLGSSCRDIAILDEGKVVFRGSPGELLESARGRVFEAVIPVDGEARLPAGVEVISRTPDGVGLRIRAVSGEGEMPPGAEPVPEPTLEEAYLAFMARRGRAHLAAAGVEA